MQLVLSINLGNEAMQTPEDVAMALINSARAIQHHDEINCKAAHIVRDRNGNTVGKWEVIDQPAKPQPERPTLDSRELATVLHGLRMIQCEGRIEGCAAGDCEHFTDAMQLTNWEIDDLCDRLNV